MTIGRIILGLVVAIGAAVGLSIGIRGLRSLGVVRTRSKRTAHALTRDALPFAGYTILSGAAHDNEQGEHPAIVAETRVDIPESSVSDAVMLMDLRNTNALLFKNSGTGEFNMIYRRDDGNIGWVEPHAA